VIELKSNAVAAACIGTVPCGDFTRVSGELREQHRIAYGGGMHTASGEVQVMPDARLPPRQRGTELQWLTQRDPALHGKRDAPKVEGRDGALPAEPLAANATEERVETWNGHEWRGHVTGTEVGADCLHEFASVSASKVRLIIEAVRSDTPSIAEFEVLYAAGINLAALEPWAGRLTAHRDQRGGAA